tara:strand:+ start:1136 stop:1495 length:360 start_codon:yes stop_codon:yes gene_type:complete
MTHNKPLDEIWDNIKKLIELSEFKYQKKDFKGAIDAKREARKLMSSLIIVKKEEKFIDLVKNSFTGSSKYDLISDYKKRIDSIKKTEIIKQLVNLSEYKYNLGDYEGAIKAMRRAEKYY